ncbi:MAG: SDR family NAD(P)-dependent oxidoreductase [Nocardioidaceae bacterium]
MELSGSSVIVTGAASGLGAATAAALAEQGAMVHGFDLADAPGAAPAGVRLVKVDVTDATALAEAMASVRNAGAPLRVVVNCAGIAPSERIVGRKGVHDLARFARVVQINLVGTFQVMALAAEVMAAQEPDASGNRGVVVNTASIAAYDGQVGQAAYAASKGGIASLTLPAARDLAQHGIRVVTIAPGIMLTPMMQTVSEEFRAGLAAGAPYPSRFGAPEEYADLVGAIVRNDYLNGEVIRLDGALRMAPR